MRCPALLLIAVTLFFSIALPAWASQGAQSPNEAGEIASRQTGGGRVLSIQSKNGGYQVKVLTPDGKVRYVFIPAR